MQPLTRSALMPAAVVAYVCFAALRGQSGTLPTLALIALPLFVFWAWRRTEAPRDAEDHTERAARLSLRAVAWGIAIWFAARSGPVGRPSLDAAANLATGTVVVAALIALARIGSLGGLLSVPAASRSLDAAAFAGLLWGIATALPGARALFAESSVLLDPLAVDYATTTAGAASLLVLVAATWRVKVLRRNELGASDRAAGAFALCLAAVGAAIPAAFLDVAAPDRIVPAFAIGAAAACAWAASVREASTVTMALRATLAVLILGVPLMLLAGFVARKAPQHAGAVVLFACAAAICVGVVARRVARPLGPDQSRWLEAVAAASRAALIPEPEAALSQALFALSKASPSPNARPELWRTSPPAVLSVDIAGYLHEKPAEAPERLYALALEEPERTLRAEVLRQLEVRRPEVRPILAWLETRHASSATVVVDDDGPLGFILLPKTSRGSPLSLEEARGIRLLTDRISSLLSMSSALARSRERELLATARADAADDEVHRLEHILSLDAGRHRMAAERLAARVRTTAFSPAARDALERLERLGRLGATLYLETPPGCDATAWAALAHLAGPRSGGPFVIVDATHGREHDAKRWEDPNVSPIALSDGGTLFISDVFALPAAVQAVLQRALARASTEILRSSVLPPALIATGTESLDALIGADKLDPALSRFLSQGSLTLPRLLDRGEDLRSLILDTLARTGLRLRGNPLGVDGAALRLLLEHTWPGNEAELSEVVGRAASFVVGDQLRVQDLFAAGFQLVVDEQPSHSPLPAMARRRARPRRGGRR